MQKYTIKNATAFEKEFTTSEYLFYIPLNTSTTYLHEKL